MREVLLLLTVCLLYCVGLTLSAPGRSSSEVLIGEVDIPMRDDNDIDGESSEETTFSKKCIVRNKAYSHSQTIPSFDLNSHCLCVAGEVYCWWQTAQRSSSSSSDAPLTLSTESPPSPSTRKATTENNNAWIDEDDDQDYSGSVSEQPQEAYQSAQQQQQNINHPTDSSMEDEVNDDDDDDDDDEDDQDDAEEDDSYEPDDVDEDEEDEAKKDDKAKAAVASSPEVENSTATAAASTTAKTPATCLVMGRTYRAGEVLPHTTGNCVECSCGQQGRIECAPHDCVGLRPQRPGGGGGGRSSNDLELFDLDRDPGIYESF